MSSSAGWTEAESALFRAVLASRAERSPRYGKWIEREYNARVDAEAEAEASAGGAAPPRRKNNKQCQGKHRRMLLATAPGGGVAKRRAPEGGRRKRVAARLAEEAEEEDAELRELIVAFESHALPPAAR